MSQFQNFSSLPPEQEATFAVYEERVAENSKKAATLGIVVGVGIGLLILIIAFTVTPTHSDPMAEPGSDRTEQLQK